MNRLANAMTQESNKTVTENGLVASKTTKNACLDLFSTIGALRQTFRHGKTDLQEKRAERLFEEAYKENKLLATKTIFYARDVREGLGERDVVKNLLSYAASNHPEAVKDNLDLIGVYGRYDDLYTFIETPLENEMWKIMKIQFEEDRTNMEKGLSISLLAKWIKTPDASSKKTRQLGILTAKKLGYSVYDFKRILRSMRKYIGIIERHMSANEWDQIKYPEVPSRAMALYRNAFRKHDESRFANFTQKALNGEEKINSATLFPYDIIENYLYKHNFDDDVLEAQWRQLPDYVDKNANVLIMADVSGSMCGRPMASSIGLALYFAERNKGDFGNMFMTFSQHPDLVTVKGNRLNQKIEFIRRADWEMDTNIEAALDKILDLAIANHVSNDELPKALIIITDMEFNDCVDDDSDWLFYDKMVAKFEKEGYIIPNIIFWNVNSRHDTFHAASDYKGVIMVSGHATSTFKNLIKCLDMTPEDMMLEVLNSERYNPITIAS